MIGYGYIIVLIFCNVLFTTVAFNCTVNLELSQRKTVQVWVSNNVILSAAVTLRNWYFNYAPIANSPDETDYYNLINEHFPQGTNFNAYFGPASSHLTFTNASTLYYGNYYGNSSSYWYAANLTVYDVIITAANFALRMEFTVCNAYLTIDESLIPSGVQISRTATSSNTNFGNQTNESAIRFPIIDSNLNVTNGSISTEVSITYAIIDGGCSAAATLTKKAQIAVPSIEKPNITLNYTSGSCNVKVHHQANVSCVRQVSYCLRINNGTSDCNNYTILNEYSRNFSMDSNSVVILSVGYDVIYTKYQFDMNVSNCMSDLSTVESTTISSSSSINLTSITNSMISSASLTTFLSTTVNSSSVDSTTTLPGTIDTTSSTACSVQSSPFGKLFTIDLYRITFLFTIIATIHTSHSIM